MSPARLLMDDWVSLHIGLLGIIVCETTLAVTVSLAERFPFLTLDDDGPLRRVPRRQGMAQPEPNRSPCKAKTSSHPVLTIFELHSDSMRQVPVRAFGPDLQ